MSETSTHKLSYHGTGGRLFGIQIVNLLLIIFTLGIYYPWARAKVLKYIYSETEWFESRFTFHGTGKELFMGFIKIIGIFIIIIAIYMACVFSANVTLLVVGVVFYMVSIFSLIPVAIHGMLRYRLSRTSWRGIHFGYRGILKELYVLYIKGILLSIVTLFIYSAWFSIDLRRYIYKNMRFGNITFSFNGDGKDYLMINLKGIFLSIITFGIYLFWYMKEVYAYSINESRVHQDGNTYELKSNITGVGVLWLYFSNGLLILFTLGFGMSWAITRELNYFLANTELVGDFNPETIIQTEEDYTNAAGENISDFMDLSMF
jgi:uncharacterized membrane protein YjgN (DUF898 family)